VTGHFFVLSQVEVLSVIVVAQAAQRAVVRAAAPHALAHHASVGVDHANGVAAGTGAAHPPLEVTGVGAEGGARQAQPESGAVGGVVVAVVQASRHTRQARPGRPQRVQRVRRGRQRLARAEGDSPAPAIHADLQPACLTAEDAGPIIQLHPEVAIAHRHAALRLGA
jgi:hypothetical protein